MILGGVLQCTISARLSFADLKRGRRTLQFSNYGEFAIIRSQQMVLAYVNESG